MAGRGPSANPLAHVLQALGEELDLITYNTWHVLLPEGNFLTQVGLTQTAGTCTPSVVCVCV